MERTPPDLQLALVNPSRRFEEVAGQLRALISSGRLKTGDRLPTERELATAFGVARNTVREALRALELAGLIELRKGSTGGAFVRAGSSNAVVNGMRDLYFLGAISPAALTEARILLSDSIVRLACARIEDKDIEALEANANAAEAARKRGDYKERQRLNQHFHVLLARVTGNPILIATMEGVMEVMRQFVESTGPFTGATDPSRQRLLRHLRDRDPDAAAQEMTSALVKLHRVYLARAKEQGTRAS